MQFGEEQIAAAVERVAKRLAATGALSGPARASAPAQMSGMGVFATIADAVSAATAALRSLGSMPLEARGRMIEAMRRAALANVGQLARMAVDETGLGRYEHKLIKNRLAITKTPGIEILETEAWTGDNGLTLLERAAYGVIGSITPCTNPTETIINNAIGMIAAGNAVVVNAHPTAKKVTLFTIDLLNRAIVEAGGPPNLIATVAVPTIASANELMKHPGIALLVVTGGPAVVGAAMASGKKVIAAGPGNPPVVVDETADLANAARCIVEGASFDNNIVCIVEKEIIAVEAIADKLLAELKKSGAYILNAQQLRRLEKKIINRAPARGGDHGEVNKDWVGKDARLILQSIDIDVKDDIRLIVAEASKDDPIVQMELLMPVVGFVRAANVNNAIDIAVEVEHGFRHTAVMHSKNIDNLSRMARAVNTSIFVKNAPSFAGLGAGGEGYTSFTIASPTGEGLTTARHFSRERRCTLKDSFRII
ncbi:MAG: aldehyde dehydrogenase EutE [Nitrospinae bacterium]|nr:aldehyde dehydrogenase EutE [Nitrospinota bacterium]